MKTPTPNLIQLARTPRAGRPWRTRTALLALPLLLASPACLQAATLTPERTLRIEFITTPPFIESNPNVLGCALGYLHIVAPYGSITASLYNGSTLLGKGTSSLGGSSIGTYSMHFMPVTWKTATSPWYPYGTPVVVDLTSLHNGTIAGRIDITISTGQIGLNYEDIYLRTIFATYSNGGSSIPPYPIITSVRLIPELPGDPEPPGPPPSAPPVVELDPEDDFTTTVTEFKAACEEAQGNAVVLDHSLKIVGGGGPQEHFPFGCTLILGPNVKLEMEGVDINFDGPLVVQSSRNAEMILKQSLLVAPTVSVNLTGTGSTVSAQNSTMHAAGGDLTIALGDESKLGVVAQRSGTGDSLSAVGRVLIRGGKKWLAEFAGTSVYASANLQLDMPGTESVLKVSGSLFASAQGSLTVAGLSSKATVEMTDSGLFFRQAGTIRLNGADGLIKLNQVELGSYEGTVTSGGVTIEAGTGTAARGGVELSETAVAGVPSVFVRGSKTGSAGFVKMEKSTLSATREVRVESGSQGKTEVKVSDINAGAIIRIATGSGGSCSSGSNDLSAPVVQECP